MINRGELMKKENEEIVDQEIEDQAIEENEKNEEKEITASLEQKLTEATSEVTKWKNDYYKVFADMENLKRRLQSEHENALKFMLQDFASDLLPVVDNLERATQVENPTEEMQAFLKGFQMVTQQLLEVLKKNGVEEIEALGKEFDPQIHQAVMTCEDENFDSNIVVEELQKGYKLKERVLRASLVKVNQ